MTRFAGTRPLPALDALAEIDTARVSGLPAVWTGGYWRALLAGYGNFSHCEVTGLRPLRFQPVNRVEVVVT